MIEFRYRKNYYKYNDLYNMAKGFIFYKKIRWWFMMLDNNIIDNYILNINFLQKDLEEKNKKLNSVNDSSKEKIIKSINELQAILKIELGKINKLSKCKYEWENYNDQYVDFLQKRMNSNINEIINILQFNISNYNISSYGNLIFALLTNLSNYNVLEIFDHFKYGNSNYVLFGKNGAGKTTLLRKLANNILNINSIVIPANRSLVYASDCYFRMTDLTLNNALSNTDGNSLFYLSMMILNQELDERRDNKTDENIIFNKMKNIFERLGIDRQIDFDSNHKLILKNGNNQYSISFASDGEKTALYFIMAILLAPKNNFVFIDEPENHLNGALMRKLFDLLECERSDLKFVYASHNIQFIESRKNCKLCYLEKGADKNNFIFKDIDDFDDIPLDIILNIEGTNDDVIFCEGTDKNSLDNRLYKTLFPNYQIIASTGCDKVINQVNIFNKNQTVLKKKSFGIVDNDFKTEDEIELLNKNHINVLAYNEIENFYLMEICLKKIIENFHSKICIDELKSSIISEIVNKKNFIKKDFATKIFRTLHMENKFTEVENINKELERINENNNNKFLGIYNAFSQKLDDAIDNSDYDNLMSLVPGKMLINFVSRTIGISNVNLFAENILNIILNNEEIKTQIKSKIIGDLV